MTPLAQTATTTGCASGASLSRRLRDADVARVLVELGRQRTFARWEGVRDHLDRDERRLADRVRRERDAGRPFDVRDDLGLVGRKDEEAVRLDDINVDARVAEDGVGEGLELRLGAGEPALIPLLQGERDDLGGLLLRLLDVVLSALPCRAPSACLDRVDVR
jgi:hypothetical protein